jgi:allophanate hydrolase subunit 2
MSIEILREGTLSWVGAGAWQGPRTFRAGDLVHFGFPEEGARSYLSVIGGFGTTTKPATGKIFEGDEGLRTSTNLSEDFLVGSTIRVYRGSDAALLDWPAFRSETFIVSGNSNRMGIRLQTINPTFHQIDLPSEPTDVGIIQMPPSGNPIILGPDGPTIGGYPKIACVIEADLSQVAQLPPGHEIRFVEVDRAEGMEINRMAKKEEERLKILLRSQAQESFGL